MASAIVFCCPTCKARIKAPIQIIGQTRACPGCKHFFVVPTQTPGDSGPALLLDAANDADARRLRGTLALFR
jgi:uncharacterized paraquat-inducible protein A